MKKQDNSYQCKTEFLFECDAEKAVLMEASRPKKEKFHKRIIKLTAFILFFSISITIILTLYKNKKIDNINASLIQINANKTLSEKLNNSSKKLKIINNNYNKKYEIIVNKANPIDKELINNYKQVNVKNNLYKNLMLEEQTYYQYKKLKENLEDKGYSINIKNGFRTFDETKALYNIYLYNKGEKYVKNHVDLPGQSEHNTGLSFDFILSKNEKEVNEKTDEYKYLEQTAHLYGFIIRYPKGKEEITGYSYDPWHLRYVGIELAKYLTKNNLTLEEYYY